MKKSLYAALCGVCLWALCACDGPQPQKFDIHLTIRFEQEELEIGQAMNTEPYQEEVVRFSNHYEMTEWGASWYGIAVSRCYDTETPGYVNEFSVACGKAASGNNFGLGFYDTYHVDETSCQFQFNQGSEYTISSMMLCLPTYVHLAIKDGNDGFGACRKFGDGDWYKAIFTAYNAQGESIGSKDVYLADYRDGNHYLMDTWEKVDFSDLGPLNRLTITMESTDVGQYGMNTPSYICLDDIDIIIGEAWE